jgi:regulatory protein
MVKITDLKPQKRNPDRFNVYLDGEFGFGIARAIAPWLQVGATLDPEQIRTLQQQDEEEQAYQKSLHYLSYRNRSEAEIRRHLEKKELSSSAISAALERLKEQDLVDDLNFAQEWVENRNTFRPRGKKALSNELYQKGISREIIQEVLQDLDESELARQLAQKKMSRVQGLDREDFQKKLYGYLSRKGFHYGVCKEIVRELWEKQNSELLD